MNCRLCRAETCQTFLIDERRSRHYWVCPRCEFVFADPIQYLSPQVERERYSFHQNGPDQPGYVQFLSPVVEVLSPYLKAGDLGLDYGSGPGPIMPLLLGPLGVQVLLYDPYFHPRDLAQVPPLQFITCTEAFEHFYDPAKELDWMTAKLKSGGFLLLMTDFHRGLEHFRNWAYRSDDTHVGFLSQPSLYWLAAHWGYSVLSTDGRISLLKKN